MNGWMDILVRQAWFPVIIKCKKKKKKKKRMTNFPTEETEVSA